MRGQMLRLVGMMALALIVVFSAISTLYEYYSSTPGDYLISATQLAETLEQEETALVQHYPLDAVYFPDELMQRLETGEIVGLVNDQQETLFYRLSGTNILEIGPFRQNKAESVNQWRLLFIGCMLLVFLLLVWPMFRDLHQLQNRAIRFNKKPFRMPDPTNGRSKIYPLAETFRRTANMVLDYCEMNQDLARTVAHEIRTPLARIKFQLALESGESEQKKIISGATKDIEQLVEKYLNFARLEIQEQSISPRPVCVGSFFDELALKLEEQCPQLEIGYYFEDGKALLEPDTLTIAVQNLVSNANKYANNSGNGRVDLRFEVDATHCSLTIEDNGPGLKGDTRVLTDAFTRAATDDQGYGLGLYIVKKVMVWHDGELHLDRSPRLGGTRSTLKWPNAL